jgi:redox-sensitive bicupin YhaK (pirin superfamily)
MIQADIIKSEERGFYDHGWLQTYHSFSFADYYDPKRINFGALRVVNDDVVHPNKGFGMHPHQNMEIITIPISGMLEHEDSTGSKGIITAGEVQVMSAGKGIMHSERNPANEPVNLLQIWIFTGKQNVVPRYEQKKFNKPAAGNTFQLFVSPDSRNDSLWIYQDAFISGIYCEANTTVTYPTYMEGNGIFLFVIEGSAAIENFSLAKRDSISIIEEKSISVYSREKSHYLFIEVPMIKGN